MSVNEAWLSEIISPSSKRYIEEVEQLRSKHLFFYRYRGNLYGSSKPFNELKDLHPSIKEVDISWQNQELHIMFIGDAVSSREISLNKRKASDHKYVHRPHQPEHNQSLSDIYPRLYEKVRECRSVKADGTLRYYLRPAFGEKDIADVVNDMKRHNSTHTIKHYIEDYQDQLRELTELELGSRLVNYGNAVKGLQDTQKNTVFALLHNDVTALKHQAISGLEPTSFNDAMKLEPPVTNLVTDSRFSISSCDDKKPLLLSERETIIRCPRRASLEQFVPEATAAKRAGKPTSDYLTSRQLVIGENSALHEQGYVDCSEFFHARSFMGAMTYAAHVELFPPFGWTPELNKVFVHCAVAARHCFPVRLLGHSIYSKFFFMSFDTANNAEYMGFVQVRMRHNIDIILHMFRVDGAVRLFNLWGCQVFPTQSLAPAVRWQYIEYNIAKYILKRERELEKDKDPFIYQVRDTTPAVYLMSIYSVSDLKKRYASLRLEAEELDRLVEYLPWKGANKTEPMFLSTQQPQPEPEPEPQRGGGVVEQTPFHHVYSLDIGAEDTEYVPPIAFAEYSKLLSDIHQISESPKFRLMNPLHFISRYYGCVDKVKYDRHGLPYEFSNVAGERLLVNKFVYWDRNIYFFFLTRLYQLQDVGDVVLVSANLGIIEPYVFYNPLIKITHVDYQFKVRMNLPHIINLRRAIKRAYGQYHIDYVDTPDAVQGTTSHICLDMVPSTPTAGATLEEYVDAENQAAEHMEGMLRSLLPKLNRGGTLSLLIVSLFGERMMRFIHSLIGLFDGCQVLKVYEYDKVSLKFQAIVLRGYTGRRFELRSRLSAAFLHSVREHYGQVLQYFQRLRDRFHALNDQDMPKIERASLVSSLNAADMLGFKYHDIRDPNYMTIYKYKMFAVDSGVHLKIMPRQKIRLKLQPSTSRQVPSVLRQQALQMRKAYKEIDVRPSELYFVTKKKIKVYEHTLNRMLHDMGVNNGGRPVSRAWIKMWEVLAVTGLLEPFKREFSSFHLCEAPGNFIDSLRTYIDANKPNLRHHWHATTLNPKSGNNNAFGDDYGMIRNNPDRWTYGSDGTGDITKPANIRHYKAMCSEYDAIIGDCGLAKEAGVMAGVRLFSAQMVFILHNLRRGGSFVLKHVLPVDKPFYMDLLYLMYGSFEQLQVYKPMQNKNSEEFYIIGTGYKRNIPDRVLDALLDALTHDRLDVLSLFDIKHDDFSYQLYNMHNMLVSSWVAQIDRQLFFTDQAPVLTNEVVKEISSYIEEKNKDWVRNFMPHLANQLDT